jgi:hypothetical protein
MTPKNHVVDGEEAREIPRYPGYLITKTGRVFSMWAVGNRGKLMPFVQRELAASKDKDGYLRLRLGNKTNRIGVHRLVLLAWVGPAPEGTEACHNNGNCADNNLQNLRWDTRTENARDSFRHGRQAVKGAQSHLAKLNGAQVSEIRARHRRGETITSIARDYPVTYGAVLAVVRNRSWRHIN